MEKSRSWPSAHDWKSCIPQKGIEGSNPSFSAKKEPSPFGGGSFFRVGVEEGFEHLNASVRWTLAECQLDGIHSLIPKFLLLRQKKNLHLWMEVLFSC